MSTNTTPTFHYTTNAELIPVQKIVDITPESGSEPIVRYACPDECWTDHHKAWCRERRGAAGRMGSSRQAAGRIYGFYRDVQQRGTAEALRQLGLGDLVGKPAIDALARLTDAVCPPGGPQDQAIARDAFAEAVVNLAVEGIADIAALTADQWQSLFLDFITRSIEARIVNDIGTKSVTMPTDLKAAQQVERSLHQLVDGCVKDAFAETLGKGETLRDNQIQAGMDSIYQVAFAFLEALPS